MDWRTVIASTLDGLVALTQEARLTLVVTALMVVLLGLLWYAVARRNRPMTTPDEPAGRLPEAAAPVPIPLASAAERVSAAGAAPAISLEGISLGNVSTILPRNPRVFLALVVGIVALFWGTGFILAEDRTRLLATPEWRFQPIYIAAHLVTLRLMIGVYTRNFTNGVAQLAVDPDAAEAGVRNVIGPIGRLVTLAIALPFCVFDYRYLVGERYTKLGGETVQAADLVMWGIWSFEWIINAFMWVVLIGYSIKNCMMLRAHPFKAPVDVVLFERHYRPFLNMSAQGASVLLGFSLVSVLYITYTGGELSDYMGLAITCILLILGFLVPWMGLKAKIRRAVLVENARLQQRLKGAGETGAAMSSPGDLARLERRLDEAVAMLRITHLENTHRSVGRTEAKAILFRLLAPLATIGWQLTQNIAETLLKLERFLGFLLKGVRGLGG